MANLTIFKGGGGGECVKFLFERSNMADDTVNENEVSTQNGGGDGKKDGETRNIKDDKENEAFVQGRYGG